MAVTTPEEQLAPEPAAPDPPATPAAQRRGLPAIAGARAVGRSWLGQGRARLSRVPLTRFGWSVLAGSALCWITGVVLGWLELVTMAAIGVLLVLVAVPFTFGRTSVSTRLALTSLRVVVGERVAGELRVENQAQRRQLPFDLELPVGEGAARFAVPSLSSGGVHEELLIIPTERRGVIPVGPASAVRGDPLGLLRRGRPAGQRQEIYVHPKTARIERLGRGFLRDLDGVETEVLSNSDLAFHALREYAPGDDRRHIHWRSSARTNQLMVRQFADTRRSHLTLVLSADARDYASDDEYELAVSVVGSIGLRALRDEQQLSVVTAGELLPTRTGQRLLDALAGVSCVSASRAALPDDSRVLRNVGGGSLLVLVGGSTRDPGQARAAAKRLGGGQPSLCVRACLGQESSYAEVAGVPTLSLGDLADLRRLLRAAS